MKLFVKAFAIKYSNFLDILMYLILICEHPMPDLSHIRHVVSDTMQTSKWGGGEKNNLIIPSLSVIVTRVCCSSAWLVLKSVSRSDGSGAGQTLDWFLMLVCSVSGERRVLSDNY